MPKPPPPNTLAHRIKKEQEIPTLALQGYTGLSLKLDFSNRDKNSWQQLDNFDLYVPGSLRKILPAVLYGGPYGANILNALEYIAQANNPAGGIRRLIGVGADGNLYDLASATPATPYALANYLIGDPITIPTILQYPGFFIPFNIRSWQASTAYAQYDAVLEYGTDGNLYVYTVLMSGNAGTSGSNEPIWPASGTVVDNTSLPSFSSTPGGTTSDNTVVWTCKNKPAWAASHDYSVGNFILDTNKNIQIVSTILGSGESGLTQPGWATTLNAITVDSNPPPPLHASNAAYWKCLQAPAWQPGTVYATNSLIIDQNGNIQEATTGGTSASNAGVVWTNVGEPSSSRFFAYYLAIIPPGTQPIRIVEWQYDPTNGSETPKITAGQMGCSAAAMPMNISGQVTTPNLNGYAPAAGRAYQWSFYNPQTLQESSPSPFVGATAIIENDESYAQATIDGSVLIPLPQSALSTKYSSYQSFYLSIPSAALIPAIGSGYTCIKVYATQDGGTTFFVVNTLFDNNGNQISNSDGSVPITLLNALSTTNSWTDYYPIPEPQVKVPSVRLYEGRGPVNYAPDPVNLGTPAWTPGQSAGSSSYYVASNAAPDGNNAIAIESIPNSDHPTYRSSNIPVQSGTEYYFQMTIDNTNGTGGNVEVRIVTPAGTILETLTQSDSTAGVVDTTFTPTVSQVFIQCYISGTTIATNGVILWYDPILQVGSSLNTAPTNYPTTDDSLTIPAPVAFANNPPPIARACEMFLDAFIFVDHQDPSKFWWSQQGAYELVGANSYQRTTTNVGTAILQLIRMIDRLVFIKERSMEQITTYPPPAPTAIDAQHGGLAYRSGVPFGLGLFALMTHGLGKLTLSEAVAETQEIDAEFETVLIGDDIKPIIDSINPDELHAQNLTTKLPSPQILNTLNLFLIAYAVGTGYNDNVLVRYMGTTAGFSNITALPNDQQIITLKEVQAPSGGTGDWSLAGNGALSMMALTADSKSYILFAGTQDGTITATAVTQPLPTPTDLPRELWNSNKVFREIYFEGEDLGNFQVYVATDAQLNANGTFSSFPWGPFSIINNLCNIGGIQAAKRIGLKLVHSAASATGVTPLITYININYDIEGVNS